MIYYVLTALGSAAVGYLVRSIAAGSEKSDAMYAYESLRNENEKMKRRYQELEQQKSELLSHLDAANRKRRELEEMCENLRDNREDKEKEMGTLRDENRKMRTQIAEYREACAVKDEEIQRLRK